MIYIVLNVNTELKIIIINNNNNRKEIKFIYIFYLSNSNKVISF